MRTPQKLKSAIKSAVESKKVDIGKVILGIMTSPDYKFRDFKAIVMNGYMKNTSLITELSTLNMREIFKKRFCFVPYLTRRNKYCDRYKKYCILCRDIAHIPDLNGMQAVFEEIVKISH